MTVTIELSPEEEARLLAQARQQGQEPQDRAHDLVRAGLQVLPSRDMTPEQHTVLIKRLFELGLMTTLPTHPGMTVPFQPIAVIGPPVSQTLQEDREPSIE